MKLDIKKIVIFILCFIIGIGLTMLSKSNNNDHAFVSAKVITDNQVTIEAEKEEINKLNKIIKETMTKIENYESEYTVDSGITDSVENNYTESKKAAGYTDVCGKGITIFLDDGTRNLDEWENANDIVVHDLDLIIIINELVEAGAEAISINGERYISTTEISCSGHTVKINGRTHARPFYINVIGDQSTLYSAMTIPGGYGDILTEYGLIFNVEKSNSVVVPAYKGSLTMDYMIMEEGGE